MTAVDTLKRETVGRKVLVVASVDMAHVGPAFNDSFVMDAPQRERLQKEDEGLITPFSKGMPPASMNKSPLCKTAIVFVASRPFISCCAIWKRWKRALK